MKERPNQQQQAAIPRRQTLAERYKGIGIEALKGATVIRAPKRKEPRKPVARDTD